jgi:hypothetical protein
MISKKNDQSVQPRQWQKRYFMEVFQVSKFAGFFLYNQTIVKKGMVQAHLFVLNEILNNFGDV